MTSALIFLLYLFGVPYILLMVMVVVGMFRPGPRERSSARPSVTVVVPAHDEEDDLPGTLESLAAQRYDGELEFVIVDDRSTDGTRRSPRATRASGWSASRSRAASSRPRSTPSTTASAPRRAR